MALWKPFRGNRTTLDTVEKHDGYVYFCVDDGSLFFDYIDTNGDLQRKQINAKDCETIMGKSLEELKKSISWNDLLDRPFGEVEGRDYLVEETSIKIGEAMGGTETYVPTARPFSSFEENQIYYIVFDGEVYPATYDPDEEIINVEAIDLEIYCNESNSITVFVYMSDPRRGETHTFGMYTTELVTAQIDEKYIPDTIARVSDISLKVTLTDDGESVLADKSFEEIWNTHNDGGIVYLMYRNGVYQLTLIRAEGAVFELDNGLVHERIQCRSYAGNDLWTYSIEDIVASSQYYGGIKAEPKTDEYTVPVMIGENGFLYVPATAGQVQPDWNQNDETDPTYIKNRTHWSKVSQTEILPECQLEISEAGFFAITNEIEATEGYTYIVNWNGNTHTCVASLLNGMVCIGNGMQIGEPDTGEPFLMGFYPASIAASEGVYAIIIPLDGSTTCTISIVERIEEIHKIENKYLSNEVLAKPDWSAAEGDFGYILNRTHYTEEVLEEIIPETTVTFGDATKPGYDTGTATGTATQIYPERGEQFVIEWNGIKYYSEVRSYTKLGGSFGRGIGNTGMFGGAMYQEYPFLVGFLTEEEASATGHTYFVWVNDGSTDATFSVSKVGELVHKLDSKYLPENIATTEYVNSIAASKPKITTVTLSAANWTGSTNPWSQEVTINGLTATCKIDPQLTALQIVELQNEEITLMFQNDNGVATAWAIGNKPTEDYTLQILLTEVEFV